MSFLLAHKKVSSIFFFRKKRETRANMCGGFLVEIFCQLLLGVYFYGMWIIIERERRGRERNFAIVGCSSASGKSLKPLENVKTRRREMQKAEKKYRIHAQKVIKKTDNRWKMLLNRSLGRLDQVYLRILDFLIVKVKRRGCV